jgi:hypothetical protein
MLPGDSQELYACTKFFLLKLHKVSGIYKCTVVHTCFFIFSLVNYHGVPPPFVVGMLQLYTQMFFHFLDLEKSSEIYLITNLSYNVPSIATKSIS